MSRLDENTFWREEDSSRHSSRRNRQRHRGDNETWRYVQKQPEVDTRSSNRNGSKRPPRARKKQEDSGGVEWLILKRERLLRREESSTRQPWYSPRTLAQLSPRGFHDKDTIQDRMFAGDKEAGLKLEYALTRTPGSAVSSSKAEKSPKKDDEGQELAEGEHDSHADCSEHADSGVAKRSQESPTKTSADDRDETASERVCAAISTGATGQSGGRITPGAGPVADKSVGKSHSEQQDAAWVKPPARTRRPAVQHVAAAAAHISALPEPDNCDANDSFGSAVLPPPRRNNRVPSGDNSDLASICTAESGPLHRLEADANKETDDARLVRPSTLSERSPGGPPRGQSRNRNMAQADFAPQENELLEFFMRYADTDSEQPDYSPRRNHVKRTPKKASAPLAARYDTHEQVPAIVDDYAEISTPGKRRQNKYTHVVNTDESGIIMESRVPPPQASPHAVPPPPARKSPARLKPPADTSARSNGFISLETAAADPRAPHAAGSSRRDVDAAPPGSTGKAAADQTARRAFITSNYNPGGVVLYDDDEEEESMANGMPSALEGSTNVQGEDDEYGDYELERETHVPKAGVALRSSLWPPESKAAGHAALFSKSADQPKEGTAPQHATKEREDTAEQSTRLGMRAGNLNRSIVNNVVSDYENLILGGQQDKHASDSRVASPASKPVLQAKSSGAIAGGAGAWQDRAGSSGSEEEAGARTPGNHENRRSQGERPSAQ
jgi:hypothetical protein